MTRASTRALAALCLACSVACASAPPDPYFGDKPTLVIGVDPEAEANAVVHKLEALGYYEVRRLRGRAFTALGFAQISGDARSSRVRVVTTRGIALALDSEAPTLLTKGRRVTLLDYPYRDTRDLDRDGREELFIREEPLPRGAPCLRMYRVHEDGRVEEKTGEGLALPKPADSRDPGFVDAVFCAAEQTEAEAEPGSGSGSGPGSESGSESGSEPEPEPELGPPAP